MITFKIEHTRPCYWFSLLNRGLGYTLDSFDEIGLFVDNEQVVGIISLNYRDYSTYLDIYAPKFQLNRSALTGLLNHVFAQTTQHGLRVSSANTKCQRFLTRLGFQQEGCLRKDYDGKNDAMFFGMLAREWAKSPFNVGAQHGKGI